ncbi:MAG: PQQ-like beta-propeller repeat protein [Cyclobacteriaceae bacterium]|nr:PQQ-like beta-propeller repeat protein [Cyclobacteriaceae bacterium]
MKTGLIKAQILAVVFMLNLTVVIAQDWPQFLGPDRNGKTEQQGLLRDWPEGGPEVKWTVDVGIGFGGPAIKDGKVYLLDRDDEMGDILRCLDFLNGEELWRFEYEAPGSVSFPGSRTVPTVDGNYVYTCGPFGNLYCIDINTHKPVWNKNIWKDYGGGDVPKWAITQNPLIYGDLLILASQAPEAGVVAYDKATGAVKWKTPSLGPTGYVSPNVAKIHGEDHIVMVTASSGPRNGPKTGGKIIGLDPLSGTVLWEYDQWVCAIPVPGAVDAGENRVLVVGGYELGAVMIRVEKDSDGKYITTELFKTEEFGDQTKPPILYKDHFYAQYGTNNRRDGLACMNMSGEIMWKTKRDPGFNKGSMVMAEGLILATDGENSLYLIEPSPTGFKPVSSAEILAPVSENEEGAPTPGAGPVQNWAPIALANGNLLIRDQNRLICVQVAE